jgi:16S rRNA (cytosine1402-N4)-methyltransferase
VNGHIPVMVREVVRHLRCAPGRLYVDCTVGAGGHAEAILEASGPDGRVIGLDRDEAALEAASARLRPFGERVILFQEDFRRMNALLEGQGVARVDGIVMDLGLSSLQLADPDRGFSFQKDGPLDMRMDRRTGPTAADLVNRLPEKDLADLIYRFGEERRSRRIAGAIVRERRKAPIRTTLRLAEIVSGAHPRARSGRLHPATRTFQALRIAVNRELEGLPEALRDAAGRLHPGGRLCVIAFHSLEDRIVKQTFRSMEKENPPPVRVLTRKPERPEREEAVRNPRSRSARLRVAERSAA